MITSLAKEQEPKNPKTQQRHQENQLKRMGAMKPFIKNVGWISQRVKTSLISSLDELIDLGLALSF